MVEENEMPREDNEELDIDEPECPECGAPINNCACDAEVMPKSPCDLCELPECTDCEFYK